MRKTLENESAKPSRTLRRSAGGSVAMMEVSLSEALSEKRAMTSAGRPAATARSRMLPMTEPKSTARAIAAPNVPPRERKKDTELVATPMSFAGSAFWTLRTRVCMVMPRPAPSTVVKVMVRHSGVSTCSVDSNAMATNMVAVPRIGRMR